MSKLFFSKKIAWFPNALLFNLCKLVPFRKKRLWVFGARTGLNYDDNARYLFEHILNAHSDNIRCIWITKSDNVVNQVRALGYQCHLNYSFKGIYYQLRAGVALNTNGLIDFGLFPLVGGAFIVYLCHGMGFKKVYNAKYAGRSRKIKEFMDKMFSWTYRNLICVTSEYTIEQFKDMLSLSPEDKIVITGMARNDVFKKQLSKLEVLKNTPVDCSKKLILYMPTYRGGDSGKNTMEEIVSELYYSEELNSFLKETNSVFIAKMHPLTPKVQLRNRNNFYIMEYSDVKNNQELIGVSDMMITDYSSACVDFALLNRPVLFYEPDKLDFMRRSEPIYEELLPIININTSSTPTELTNRLSSANLQATDAINDLFESQSIKGTCYSENVYRAIINEIAN